MKIRHLIESQKLDIETIFNLFQQADELRDSIKNLYREKF